MTRSSTRSPSRTRATGSSKASIVLDEVAPEVAVEGVGYNPAVEAFQIGEHKGVYDIVWVLKNMDPGAEVVLTWIGRAENRGDLAALNQVSARTATQPMEPRDETVTYLGTDDDLGTENPPYSDTRKRRRTVPVNSVPPGARVLGQVEGPPSTTLPLTGMESAGLVALGIALVGAGALMVLAPRLARRRAIAWVLGAGLLLTACVSSSDRAERAPTSEPSASATAEDEPPEDRVLGERIEADEFEGAGIDDENETATDETETATETEAVVPPGPEFVTIVETVDIDASDLPSEPLASKGGDSSMTYEWDEAARRIVSAASSTRFVAGSTSALFTAVATEGNTIEATLTLHNLHTDKRLVVKGRLVHEIYDDGGLVARARIRPTRHHPRPGWNDRSNFRLLLPTGGYTAEAAFVAEGG